MFRCGLFRSGDTYLYPKIILSFFRIYLSPDSSQCSSPRGQVSVLSPTLYEPVNRSCVVEAISNPSAPQHAIQAFHLLSSSREAQAVVASLACDPNVWNAVMENPAVNSFFQSQQTVADFGVEETTEEVEKISTCASEVVETQEKWKCRFSISWVLCRM
ncbi:hypothetical protein E2542_SST30384 [Spatholobus suberectus]|nr:hypothetical protein E2542_SST30384 [Spatholobus suberectus]